MLQNNVTCRSTIIIKNSNKNKQIYQTTTIIKKSKEKQYEEKNVEN